MSLSTVELEEEVAVPKEDLETPPGYSSHSLEMKVLSLQRLDPTEYLQTNQQCNGTGGGNNSGGGQTSSPTSIACDWSHPTSVIC